MSAKGLQILVRGTLVHGTVNGYSNYGCRCDDCRKWNTIYRRKQYLNDKDKFLNWGLVRRYGITLEERNDMVLAQGGGCAVCGAKEGPGGRKLHVDHNHKTGKVRGVLCDNCNFALGHLKESSVIIKALLVYLEEK